jgi:Alginate export
MKALPRHVLAGFVCGSLGVAALAEPPPFKLTRFDEDYSYLATVAAPVNFEDRLKYIRLGDEAYVSLGGELRERFDSLDAAKFGIGTPSDKYVLQRLLLSADAHLTDRMRVFVQLVQANAFDKASPRSPSDVDHLDVQNAFIDVKPDPDRHLTLRLGRQEFLFDSAQRFVSVREGPNVRQSFDGLRASWSEEQLRVDAFVTRPVLYKPGTFDDSSDHSQSFSGLYATYALDSKQSVDGYLLSLNRDNVAFGGVKGDEHRQSFGVRWAGVQGHFDHDLEGVYQTGTFAGEDIRAWAIGLTGGYTLAETWSPRLGLEFDAGSGDRHPGDGRLETFNPLFPKGANFNESALTSWANLLLLRASLGLQPTASTTIVASIYERWRETGNDAVYVQPYTPIAATLGNHERGVGTGYQLDATWRANRYFTLTAEALHQTAGPAIREAGGHAANFAMLIGQLRF